MFKVKCSLFEFEYDSNISTSNWTPYMVALCQIWNNKKGIMRIIKYCIYAKIHIMYHISPIVVKYTLFVQEMLVNVCLFLELSLTLQS